MIAEEFGKHEGKSFLHEDNRPILDSDNEVEKVEERSLLAQILNVVIVWFLSFTIVFLIYWEFHLYFKYKDSECESPLAVWCLVCGINYFVYNAFFVSTKGISYYFKKERPNILEEWGLLRLSKWLRSFENVASVVWLIVGFVDLNKIDYADHVCPAPLYNFVFYVVYVTGGLILVLTTASVMLSLYMLGFKWWTQKQVVQLGPWQV